MTHHGHCFKNFCVGAYQSTTPEDLAHLNFKSNDAAKKHAFKAKLTAQSVSKTRNMHSTVSLADANLMTSPGNCFIAPNPPDVRRMTKQVPVVGI
jgi:hypothetical protein